MMDICYVKSYVFFDSGIFEIIIIIVLNKVWWIFFCVYYKGVNWFCESYDWG